VGVDRHVDQVSRGVGDGPGVGGGVAVVLSELLVPEVDIAGAVDELELLGQKLVVLDIELVVD